MNAQVEFVKKPSEEDTVANGPSNARPALSDERLLEIHKAMVFPRLIEEKMLKLLRQGRLTKWFSGIGQEAIAVGVSLSLRDDDYILPMHRNLGVFTTRKLDFHRLLCQLMGRGDGFTLGRDRSFHFGTLEHRIVGMISHLGAMLPVADGLALSFQLRSQSRVAVPFTGDGASSEGDFHEALNLAAVWKLPVIFVIENNQYGLSTPVREQYACKRLADRAVGYGMPGELVDGNDVLAVMEAMERAVLRARAGEGPTLLEFKTFRMRGHEEASGVAYVPKELLEEWSRRDPISQFEEKLKAWGILRESYRAELYRLLKHEIDEAVDRALQVPPRESSPAEECADVYASSPIRAIPPDEGAPSSEKRYVDAVSDALAQTMERNPRTLILGQDIAEYGGVFKVTKGFVERFGRERVRNTPIIESGAIGAAMGLALEGFRPIVELQFGDFVTCGFNQIVNNLAKTHYRWGASIPVVIRMPVGGGVGAGPFHSQNPEAWFTHVAGLKVVAPSTPFDAKGLLIAAIEDPNPVLFLEHKLLYRSEKGRVPDEYFGIDLGEAKRIREGGDCTIVTWSIGVRWALEAAEVLSEKGYSIEIIDLRTLLPWDRERVMESVRKTGRALVLHEAPLTGGFGGEVAAAISEEAFEWLDAPVTRLGGLDTPVPFAKELEAQFAPRGRLLDRLEALLEW